MYICDVHIGRFLYAYYYDPGPWSYTKILLLALDEPRAIGLCSANVLLACCHKLRFFFKVKLGHVSMIPSGYHHVYVYTTENMVYIAYYMCLTGCNGICQMYT
jgi:hypothetical protein